MSSSISINVNHPDGYKSHFEVGNMTSNCNWMLVEACGVSMGWFDKVSCEKALPILEHAWTVMKRDPRKFKRLQAANGWGTYDQFMPFLTRFYVMVRLHKSGIIHNWY